MPIIVARSLQRQEGVLVELLWHLNLLVLLLLERFDQTWSHHKVFLGEEGVGSACVTGPGRAPNAMHIVL